MPSTSYHCAYLALMPGIWRKVQKVIYVELGIHIYVMDNGIRISRNDFGRFVISNI